MKYTFEKTSNVQGELTLTIEKADIEPSVTKALKDFRAKAQMPGFRRGQVPMSIIQKRFGAEVRQEEMQKVLGQKLYECLSQEKLDILGDPLSSEKQQPVDVNADEMVFVFDIAIAPDFDATLSTADSIPYYNIEVTDEMVDQDVAKTASRHGHHESVETYAAGDIVRGHLAELDEQGNIKEGGIQKEDAHILPTYIKDETQKAKFDGLQVNTVITINPSMAYGGNETELASLLGIEKDKAKDVVSDFSFQVNEISRWTPSELNTEFFDLVLGEGVATTEEEFRAAIRQRIEQQFAQSSRMRFIIDARDYLINRIGQLEWPEEMLKRVLRARAEEKDKDKSDEELEKEIRESLPGLTWHICQERLLEQTGIKIEKEDILNEARVQTRMQFAQFGYVDAPADLVDRYANSQLEKKEQVQQLQQRATDTKLGEALLGIVTLDQKNVSLAEFNKLYDTPSARN